GRHGELRAVHRRDGRDRRVAALWAPLLRGPRGRRGDGDLPLLPDSAAHARGMLQGFPPQQLARCRDLLGPRRRCRRLEEALRMTLVIYAHPYPARSRACAALLEGIRGMEGVEIRSLYDLYPDFDIDGDAERHALESARLVVWMHPMYWYSVPALMKHWLDQ